MDREPLGWSVKRHVFDVSFRELEPLRLPIPDAYVLVGQAVATNARDERLEVAVPMDNVRSGEPFPAL
ncbi:MAG: hypothetical protein ABIO16_00180 [Nocardioides sp.]